MELITNNLAVKEGWARLPLRYYGTVAYFAALAAWPAVVIADNDIYDKRAKETHRCLVADTHGLTTLTMPVAKPHGIRMARWNQVELSTHGNFWHVHRVTLESAYGRTPFFEFYIDSLLPYLRREVVAEYPTVAAADAAITRTLASLLQLPGKILLASELAAEASTPLPDNEKAPAAEVSAFMERLADRCRQMPYYQVRGLEQGFLPNLSVLDLLFNLGPEAPLYLRKLLRAEGGAV